MSLVIEDTAKWIPLALRGYRDGTEVSRECPQKIWYLQQSTHSSKHLNMHQRSLASTQLPSQALQSTMKSMLLQVTGKRVSFFKTSVVVPT